MAVGTYAEYLAFNKKAGANSASEDEYNRFNKLGKYAGGTPVGVAGPGIVPLGSGLSGGFTKGTAYQPGGPKSKNSVGKAALGGAAAGTAAGAGFIAAGGLGATGALAAAGPVGWAVGAGLLAYSAIKGKKTNKDFEGVRQTGGAPAWQQQGGSLADFAGDIPTQAEFTSKGRWLNPADSYAHDYGRSFSAGDAKYYANFAAALEKFKASGDTARYNATLQSHGFKAGGSAPAPAAPSAPSISRPAPPPPVAAPPAFNDYAIKDITAPAKGLENTIKTTPTLLRERRKRSYLTVT